MYSPNFAWRKEKSKVTFIFKQRKFFSMLTWFALLLATVGFFDFNIWLLLFNLAKVLTHLLEGHSLIGFYSLLEIV